MVAIAAGLAHRGCAAETPPQKVSKEVAKYQDRPNTMQACGMCKFLIPSGGKAGGMMGGGWGQK
jgi:hypothetical protein